MTSNLRRYGYPACYALLCLSMAILLGMNGQSILSPIVRPILLSYNYYDAAALTWLVMAGLGYFGRAYPLAVIADTYILGHCYFGLCLVWSIPYFDQALFGRWVVPLLAIVLLMCLRGTPTRRMLLHHAIVVIACLPLALQFRSHVVLQ